MQCTCNATVHHRISLNSHVLDDKNPYLLVPSYSYCSCTLLLFLLYIPLLTRAPLMWMLRGAETYS